MMTLREKVRSAIDNPGDWEIIGLLTDVAKELERVSSMESELMDYAETVSRIRRKLRTIEEEACDAR